MNTKPCILALLALLLPACTLLAADTPAVSDLAGSWHGQSRFTGISYAEAVQKQVVVQAVPIRLQVATDGKVTGQVGGATLNGTVTEEHRGWFWRLIHANDNFVIAGQLSGAVAPGSAGGLHPVSAPFIFDGTRIHGSLFAVCPVKYPYPFLSLRLVR